MENMNGKYVSVGECVEKPRTFHSEKLRKNFGYLPQMDDNVYYLVVTFKLQPFPMHDRLKRIDCEFQTSHPKRLLPPYCHKVKEITEETSGRQ